MNQNVHTFHFWMFLINHEGWGRAAGLRTQQKLQQYINARPDVDLFRISLDGTRRLDVTCASAGLVAVVQHYLGSRAICLINLADGDVLENIAAAAGRMKVPVTVWNKMDGKVVGLAPDSALYHAMSFALSRPEVRAGEYAAASGLSLTNASSRLKQLWEKGLLLRTEVSATSGGVEFVYRPLR